MPLDDAGYFLKLFYKGVKLQCHLECGDYRIVV